MLVSRVGLTWISYIKSVSSRSMIRKEIVFDDRQKQYIALALLTALSCYYVVDFNCWGVCWTWKKSKKMRTKMLDQIYKIIIM